MAAWFRVGGLKAAGMVSVLMLAGCAQVSGLETRARILSEPVCTDFFFPIYFRGGSAEVTAPARKVIADAAEHAKPCMVASVEVVGLPEDHDGGAPALTLARERARRLGEALAAAGLPASAFRLSSLGEAGEAAAATEASGPGRRRADVFVRFRR